MAGGSLGFVVEILVALLLAVTIGYCLVVNRKLERLRSDQSELKGFIRELNAATTHAEHAITRLQSSAGNAEEMLGSHIESARDLSNRLTHGIAQGEEIYSKLELFNQLQRRSAPDKAGTAPAAAQTGRRTKPSHGLSASKLGLGLLNAEEGVGTSDQFDKDAA